jgi:hypothetical protein
MSKKYSFKLDIDPKKVRKRFNIPLGSPDTSKDIPDNTTNLEDLAVNSGFPEVMSFLDEAKKIHNCSVCVVDFSSKKSTIESDSECWWCLHPFTSFAIGCPISYSPNRYIKEYHSDISRDKYRIKENVTDRRHGMTNDDRICNDDSEYYQTDGFFCSFNCTASYIDNHKHDTMYRLSESLLIKMYFSLMNTRIKNIGRAPDQRMLKKRGGPWNIEEFRSKFNKAECEYHGTVKSSNLFSPIATLYEEKLKF